MLADSLILGSSTYLADEIDLYLRVCPENRYYRLLMEQARYFRVMSRGYQYPQGEQGKCYNHSMDLVLRHPELTYVEGLSLGIISYQHAWVVDANGRVIDGTWKEPGLEYFGIPIQTAYLKQHALKTGWPSLLDNHLSRDIYHANPTEYLDMRFLKCP
jgi:hypothetical protein